MSRYNDDVLDGSDDVKNHYNNWMLVSNGNQHLEQRRMFQGGWYKELVDSALEQCRIKFRKLIDALPSGDIEAVQSLFIPLIEHFAGIFVGLDVPEGICYREISDALLGPLNEAHSPSVIIKARDTLRTVEELIFSSRPSNDISLLSITAVVRSLVRDGSQSRHQGVAMVSQVLTGSVHPLLHLMSNSFSSLLDFPEEMAKLLAAECETESAVSELIRYNPSFHYIQCSAELDTELRGQPIFRGDKVICAVMAANRDDSEFTAADTLMLSRASKPSASFGFGHHACLGIRATRGLLRVVLEEITNRRLAIRPGTSPNTIDVKYGMRGHRQLHLRLEKE
ncbi:cytochrome P450 [Rhizobium lemnae]|uniref:Cytochrome P450 n=1 Tax=Rhizobium lemnae TaxID=1214924 RepID=A0ABV8E436_9HYPH|nr:cytochrome P450 [Rhizobium lemnae]MCJ8510637.1 cytochrome P450 [Rhizobium lemnae]